MTPNVNGEAPLRSEHDIVLARQQVRKLTQELKFSLVDQTKMVTAASELARNALIYGKGGTMHWEVTLRCPNCEWNGSGIFQQELVERFDEELDRGTEALVRDLKRLMHANMEEEIDRFVQALDHDLILPEDF